MVKFKYLRTSITNQNYVYEEVKSRLNSGISFYCLFQNLFCIHLLSKNVKIRTYKNYNFAVLCSYGTWSVSLRKEHRLRVLENGAAVGMFGPKREEATEGWRKLQNEGRAS